MNPPPAETFLAHGHQWQKHTSGDPMPCDAEEEIMVSLNGGTYTKSSSKAKNWSWPEFGHKGAIIGWRYANPPRRERCNADGDQGGA